MTIRTCGAAFSLLVAMITPVACLAQDAPSGRILFGSAQGGMNADIYVVGADGTGLTRLTSERGGNQVAAWSPDGSRIAYRHGLDYIMVMDADGSNPQLLADTDGDNPEFDLSPDWSPDGSRIVFDSSIGGSDRDIFVVGADGTG